MKYSVAVTRCDIKSQGRLYYYYFDFVNFTLMKACISEYNYNKYYLPRGCIYWYGLNFTPLKLI